VSDNNLEMRPIDVRRGRRTHGHALVVMLAYRVIKTLNMRWRALDLTVEEGITQLTTLCATKIHIEGKAPSTAPKTSRRTPAPARRRPCPASRYAAEQRRRCNH
jgi:hypothetical protein